MLDVELHAVHAGVGGSDLIEHILTATGDYQMVAALMKSLGEGSAYTAGSASDEDRVASWMHLFLLKVTCET